MNTRKISWSILSVLMVMAMLVSACAPAATPAPTQAPAAPAAPAAEPTKAPAAPAEPTKAPEAPAAPAATGEVVVGLMTDDSGSLAIYGPMLERGWELGLEYATKGTGIAGGKTIKTVIKDTTSTPDVGVALAREAIEKVGA